MASDGSEKKNRFLMRTGEREDLNQYWYSSKTIAAMAADVEDVCAGGKRCAFLSTPSVYFTLNKETRGPSYCFDLDTQWEKEPGYVCYDFNKPTDFTDAESLKGTFDMVVIDPPFITREVWEKYTETSKFLLKPGGAVMASTIQENAEMMKELLGVEPQKFMPSIPHLVYQYYLYASYESKNLCGVNDEIPMDD